MVPLVFPDVIIAETWTLWRSSPSGLDRRATPAEAVETWFHGQTTQ